MIPHFWNWLRMLLEQQEPDEDPHPEIEIPDPEPEEPEPEPEPEPELEAPGVKHVGAWCGLASLKNADRDIAFARAHGINRLDVIVNDHSAAREPRPFTTYDTTLISRFCNKAQAAGIETHLMSWVMPHAAYIEEAAEQLIPLAAGCNAASVQWDAEEPWTRARNRLPYDVAAARLAESFKDLPCPMGVNGIGYTPAKKFGPLAEICDYVVPQCYSTRSSGQKPEEVVPRFHRRYRKLFANGRAFKPPGARDKQIVIGLAAYRQKGIPGHTVETAMRTALAGAQALEGVDTVIYWSLRHIRANRRVARVIASIRQTPPIA